jgi:membrane protease YdiL (CAAX protease family)
VYEQAGDLRPAPLPDPLPAAAPVPSPIGPRLAALLEVVLCSGYPTQIALVLVLTSLGMSLRTPQGGLTPNFVFTLSLLDAAFVVGLVVLFIRAGGERVNDVLLGRRPVLREAVVGVALVPAVFLLVIVILGAVLWLVPGLHNVPKNPLEEMVQTRRNAVIFTIVVMIAGGLREEVQRGFIVHRFEQQLGGGAVGVMAYSIAFGLGHLEQGWDAVLATGTLGAIWGCVYLVRRSIVAPMVSHSGFNLLQLIKFAALR